MTGRQEQICTGVGEHRSVAIGGDRDETLPRGFSNTLEPAADLGWAHLAFDEGTGIVAAHRCDQVNGRLRRSLRRGTGKPGCGVGRLTSQESGSPGWVISTDD
jgi:hypothetical protein